MFVQNSCGMQQDASKSLLVVALQYGGSDGAIGRQVSCIFILLYHLCVFCPHGKEKYEYQARARHGRVCRAPAAGGRTPSIGERSAKYPLVDGQSSGFLSQDPMDSAEYIRIHRRGGL